MDDRELSGRLDEIQNTINTILIELFKTEEEKSKKEKKIKKQTEIKEEEERIHKFKPKED